MRDDRKMMRMKKQYHSIYILAALIGLTALWPATARPAAGKPRDAMHQKHNLPCNTCHVKNNPTPDNSELLPCPAVHPKHQEISSTKNEPDVVLLNELMDKYDPVRFSHKKHADMAQMNNGCWMCHHNSPANQPHPACKTCHPKRLDRNSPSRLRLKAAYHRHCMDCHRKWSHGNACEVCHAKRGEGPKITLTRGLKSPYPKLEIPGKIVYQTKNKNTKVTFLHGDHVKEFGISCETCHAGATCEKCHDRTRKKPPLTPGHKVCSGCHDTKTKTLCAKCHRTDAMSAYSHDSAGFRLAPFHTGLQCMACHHAHKPIVKLNGDCRTCHKGLVFKKFNHAALGFDLKPNHTRLKCDNCHPAGKPVRKLNPNCASCHKGPIRGFNHASTGFALQSYHAALSCSKCHPANKPMRRPSTKCVDCHPGMVIRNFDHASTGFPLKKYHAALTCDKCHPAGKEFTKPNPDCGTCHGKDAFKNFKHEEKTGVALDDMHSSLDCTNCHVKGFGAPVDCSGCHNDKSYPKDKPVAPAAK